LQLPIELPREVEKQILQKIEAFAGVEEVLLQIRRSGYAVCTRVA
jgi:hypothetical protein